MQPAPAPGEWEAPFEDTSVDAHLGQDGLWHLGVSAPGWHPYVSTACGADLASLPASGASDDGTYWTMDLGRVDCGTCNRHPWKHATDTVTLETFDRRGGLISRETMLNCQASARIWEQRGDRAIGGWSTQYTNPGASDDPR